MDLKFLRGAVKEGLESMRQKPKEVDKDLEYYNKLQPSDFVELVRNFGQEGVVEYIKKMEFKRKRAG